MVEVSLIETTTPAAGGDIGRAGSGRQAVISFAVVTCSLGPLLVAATDKGVCAIWFGDDAETLKADLRRRFPTARLNDGNTAFQELVARIVDHVESPHRPIELPLDVRGTDFQEQVWRALREIPVGATATYSEIATRIGRPTAARAVAQACATNPVAVVVPCHRVVGSGGALSGYRGGVARKHALLTREGVEIASAKAAVRQQRGPRHD